MGSTTFFTTSKGKTAKDAFTAAREAALHEYGHGGYTGSIAEKRSFTVIALPPGKDIYEFIDELFEKDDPRIVEKYGPAGCIKHPASGESAWIFFGWASE